MNAPSFKVPHPAWQQTPRVPFLGSGRRNGYGYTQFAGRQYLAHRLAFALGQMLNPDALAGRFGVSQAAVSRIVNQRHWKHL